MELTAAERVFLQTQLREQESTLRAELEGVCAQRSPGVHAMAQRQLLIVRSLQAKIAS